MNKNLDVIIVKLYKNRNKKYIVFSGKFPVRLSALNVLWMT